MTTGRIEIQGLTKRFPMGRGNLVAMQGIDLSIAAGEFLTMWAPPVVESPHCSA